MFYKHKDLLKDENIRKLFNVVMDHIDYKILFYLKEINEKYKTKINSISNQVNFELNKLDELNSKFDACWSKLQYMYALLEKK